MVPPPNTGSNITPFYNGLNGPSTTPAFAVSGATTTSALDTYTQQAIGTAPTGEKVFAGSREDSFFADAPGIFDLLDARILVSLRSSETRRFGPRGGGLSFWFWFKRQRVRTAR